MKTSNFRQTMELPFTNLISVGNLTSDCYNHVHNAKSSKMNYEHFQFNIEEKNVSFKITTNSTLIRYKKI
jgi:hypothetical protein